MRGRGGKKKNKKMHFFAKKMLTISRRHYIIRASPQGGETKTKTKTKQQNKQQKRNMKKNALDLAWAYDMIPEPGDGETLWAYRPTPAERAAHRDVWGDGEWIPAYNPVLGDSWENCRPIWRASRQTSPRWEDTVWEPGWREDGDYLIYDGGEEN